MDCEDCQDALAEYPCACGLLLCYECFLAHDDEDCTGDLAARQAIEAQALDQWNKNVAEYNAHGKRV